MKANEFCPPPHMETADLEGEEQTFTIKSLGFEKVGENEETCGVITFEEFPRGMVINRGKLKAITAMYGDETDDWIGKKVTFYPAQTLYKGKMTPCMMVKEETPANQ